MKVNKPPYRTYAVARASVFVPDHKAVAQSNDAMEQLGRDILAQKDLMYIKSVLVTAGINGNDDVFFVNELWKARKTPILKPLDWKHRDSEIIGVMFSAESYDLASGSLIHANADVYDKPFEIVTEGVVYKLTFPDRAKAIRESASNGELFVSMETWFDDYNYVLYDEAGNIVKVVARNSDTVFMDSSLKAYGGEGRFSDPESSLSYRIGRGLLGLTFGGCGFVPVPANTRSVILSVDDDFMGNNSVTEKEDCVALCDEEIAQITDIIERQESVVFANQKEVYEMTDMKAEFKKALDETRAEEKAQAERAELEQKAATAATLESQKSELEGKISILNGRHDALIKSFTDTFQEVVKVVAEAGLPKPEEAENADEAMKIKLAWFQKTIASLVEQAEKAKSLQEQFDNMEKEKRVDEVKALLSDILDDEKIEGLTEAAKAMDTDTYTKWLDEKKLLVESVRAKLNEQNSAEAKETEETEGEYQETVEPEAEAEKKEEKTEEKEAEASNEDETKLLENVEVEEKPNLAGASGEEEDNDVGGFKALAEAICPVKKTADKNNKPGFDPVG